MWKLSLAFYLLFFVICFCAQMAEELLESPSDTYFFSTMRQDLLFNLVLCALWPLVGMTAIFYSIMKHKKERKKK